MYDLPAYPIRLSLEKGVLAVEMYDLASSRAIAMVARERGRCSFAKEFPHGPFLITLRLDWGQMEDGEPTLDMDVKYRRPDGIFKVVPPKKNPHHHTRLSAPLPGNLEPRLYDVEYKGLRLRLVARKTFATVVSLSAHVVDEGSSTQDKASPSLEPTTSASAAWPR